MQESELIDRISKDIYRLMDHFCLHGIELESPFREFDLDCLEGSYAQGIVGLISHLCFVNGYYKNILTDEQFKYVTSLHFEENFVPSFEDEEIFAGMEVDFSNVENLVIRNIARYARYKNNPKDFPTESFERYFRDYGDDEGLSIFE